MRPLAAAHFGVVATANESRSNRYTATSWSRSRSTRCKRSLRVSAEYRTHVRGLLPALGCSCTPAMFRLPLYGGAMLGAYGWLFVCSL
jgi:hypothetical protein